MSKIKLLPRCFNNSITAFCALSLAIHAALMLPAKAPAPPAFSSPAQPINQSLIVSFAKPAAAPSVAVAPVNNRRQHNNILLHATADIAEPLHVTQSQQRPVNINPVSPSITNHPDPLPGDFSAFLSRAAEPPAPELTALTAPSQHIKQQALDQPRLQSAPLTPGQQHSLQMRENAHLVMQRLKVAFSEYFTYPKLAQRNGWQGMVKLGLRVEPNGQLSRIRVISTSGYPVLDQAALDTLNRIAALQGANAWLIGEPVDTVLPVEYKLLGG